MAEKAGSNTDELQGIDLSVERNASCEAQVSLRVPADNLRRARGKITRNLSKRFRVKGFRPGKAPAALIEKQFGSEIDKEVLQHFLDLGIKKAIDDNDLKPAAAPRIELEALPKEGEDLEVKFELPLRPEITLGEIEGLSIEGQEVAVKEEEVEAAIADLRRQHSRVEKVEDEGLEANGMMLCTVRYLSLIHI